MTDDPNDPIAKETALTLFRTATLRSGYMLKDTVDFADTVEKMMRQSLGVPMDEEVEEEEEGQDDEDTTATPEEDAEDGGDTIDTEEHDEL